MEACAKKQITTVWGITTLLKGNWGEEYMCSLLWLWWWFHDIYTSKFTKLYKDFQLVVCQLHLNRAVTLKNVQYRFAKSLRLCPSLCDPMDCSPRGCSVHGDSPGKYTGVGCHFPLQGIFPTQGSNCGLLHCRRVLYCLSHLKAHYRFRSYFHSCPILIHLAASGTRKGPFGGGEFLGSSVVRAELAILTVFFSQNWYVYDMVIKSRNTWMKFFFCSIK